jgi:hypothetical protein
MLLCQSVFESLRIREINKAWTSFGDVEVLVGVRSIWRTWTPGSAEEIHVLLDFQTPFFLVTQTHSGEFDLHDHHKANFELFNWNNESIHANTTKVTFGCSEAHIEVHKTNFVLWNSL